MIIWINVFWLEAQACALLFVVRKMSSVSSTHTNESEDSMWLCVVDLKQAKLWWSLFDFFIFSISQHHKVVFGLLLVQNEAGSQLDSNHSSSLALTKLKHDYDYGFGLALDQLDKS